jgi:endonuclease-3
MRRLARAIGGFEEPAVEKIAEDRQEDPFQVLIATMLSAQTRDPVTHAAATRLFEVARAPRTMAKLSEVQIERLIYPVSFYRNKAVHVKEACRQIVARFGGRVPATMEELLTLPGVGRKTANLVLILAHRSEENICVDTHVHRISNRLGWVATRAPEETEQALYKVAPRRWWALINLYLVTWGQNVCRPLYPRCGACAIADLCPRIGVTKASRVMTTVLAALLLVASARSLAAQTSSPGAGAVVVLETARGTVEFETYPDEAPKTVQRVVALVTKGFYDGLRVHRAEPGFVVQMGDPATRDLSRLAFWGSGGTGTPIGVAEITKKRKHVRGAVAMAYAGNNPKAADSQFYIVLAPRPELDAKYTVFGGVIAGMDVVDRLQRTDLIKKVSVRE